MLFWVFSLFYSHLYLSLFFFSLPTWAITSLLFFLPFILSLFAFLIFMSLSDSSLSHVKQLLFAFMLCFSSFCVPHINLSLTLWAISYSLSSMLSSSSVTPSSSSIFFFLLIFSIFFSSAIIFSSSCLQTKTIFSLHHLFRHKQLQIFFFEFHDLKLCAYEDVQLFILYFVTPLLKFHCFRLFYFADGLMKCS